MPELDLRALKTTQTETARARIALNKTQAALDEAQAVLRAETDALASAQARRDTMAVTKAIRLVEASAAKVDNLKIDRSSLADKLRDRLKELRKLPLDAPGEVPLLLLPLRLETRFATNSAGKPILRIRAFPDTIHLDISDPGLTEAEVAAARLYWSTLFAAPDDTGIDAAWSVFVASVGRQRARLVARAMRPSNAGQRGMATAPQFPTPAAPVKGPGRPRLLPDCLRVTAWQQGKRLQATGRSIAHDLAVGLLAGDGTPLKDHDGLKVLTGSEWLVDYDVALAAGMALELPLNAMAAVERLYVYGVVSSRTTSDSAAELQALLTAHDGGAGLAFVPQGTPTNNTEDAGSGWQRWDSPAPIPLVPMGLSADMNGPLTALALGTGGAVLGEIAHAAAAEQSAASAMNAALWPATWGYFLETLDDSAAQLTPWVIEDIRNFHQNFVRGRGALPALRVGKQPYGVMPFAGFASAKSAALGKTEAAIEAILRKLLPNWRNATQELPRLDKGGGAEKVLEIFGHAPVSWGVRARRCYSAELMRQIEATTTTGKAAADIEAMLVRLLAESLGGFSYAYGAGSLDEESRPVLLPYADPAQDADYAQALVDGKSTGKISSVFQAIIALGWARVNHAATPPKRFAEAIRVTATIDAVMSERIIGLVTSGRESNVAESESVLKNLVSRSSENLLGPQPTPILLRGDKASLALEATSVLERDAIGATLAIEAILGIRQRDAMRNGLTRLAALGGDFSILVAETLDTASHRLDAWITALSAARLARIRAAQPTGLTIGAFGWVFDLAPQVRNKLEGGYIAAPGLDLATTAGLLRSAYLAHNPADNSGGAFAIDLSSVRVRRAMLLLQGVAQGQSLSALLGYDFERRMHDADCDRFILSFRALAPLVAGRMNAEATEVEAQTVAGVNVTDMLRLLDIWNDPARGASWVFAQLARVPEGNEYLEPGTWDAPSLSNKSAIAAAMAQGVEDADALADLMLAESVHQLAQGNMARASATLDAGGRGEAPPPDQPDVLQTRGPGGIVTHRLIAVPPTTTGAWPTVSPRAQANPEVEAWAAARLGDPARISLGQGRTLAHTGLAALDFAALAAHPDMLLRVLRARAGLANPDADFPDTAPTGQLTLTEAMHIGAALQEVLERAQPLGGLNIGLPGASGWVPAAGAIAAALARLDVAAGMLQSRLVALDGLLASAAVSRAALMTALLDLTDFGIVLPDLTEAQVADLARLAMSEGVSRWNRVTAARSEGPRIETVAKLAEAVFGPAFPLPVAHVFAPSDSDELMGETAVTAASSGTIARYLADFGSVRPMLGSFSRLSLLSGIGGNGPRLTMRQMCGVGDNPPDYWIGGIVPADRPSFTGAVVSLLADAPEGLSLADGITGLLLDEWTETMSRRTPLGEAGPVMARTTAGVAIHADAPGAEPPQVLLLALSPDGSRWTEDTLCNLFDDVLDLAKARLITLETLPLVGRILPAIYTQSWSLQGEAVIDWTKILVDKTASASSAGIRNFTFVKEA